MVKLTTDGVHGIMHKKNNIRNVTVISSLSQDRTCIDAIGAAAGIISPKVHVDGITNTPVDEAEHDITSDTHADEAERNNTSSSPDLSLYYKFAKESLNAYRGEREGELFLVNIIDVPRHTDPREISAEMCLADGAMLVVDSCEGITSDVETSLHQALCERIVPVLCVVVNMMDYKHFLDYQDNGEKVYQTLCSVITNANAVAAKYEDKMLGNIHFSPERGNVSFLCLSEGWGFTLTDFARLWATKLGVLESEMVEKLWGDNFYDMDTEEWTRRHTGAETCKRGFVTFCFDTILKIMNYCTEGKQENVWKAIEDLQDIMKPADKKLTGESFWKCVMQKWLPAGDNLLRMIVLELPSPAKAQKYRVENLYNGPLNDLYASAIRGCDPDGPLILYVSKTITDKGRLLAFGRVFSGTVQASGKVFIVGPNHVRGQKKELYMETLQGAVMLNGKNQDVVQKVPCGNMAALVGLGKFIKKNVTLTNQNKIGVGSIRAISLSHLTNQEIDGVTLMAVGQKKDYSLPYSVYDNLYPHQRYGIIWLWSLHCKNKGGILADDMGLGKTRQVSAFLRGLFHSEFIKRAMIVTPPTVIDQWEKELAKVDLRSSKFTKAKDTVVLKTVAKEGGILLTSYEMYSNHEELILSEVTNSFDYVIADEGHMIKNSEIDTSKALLRINCHHKIMLTGTPIQNNILEFHTLMSFCNPTLLGSSENFEKDFAIPIDRGKYKDSDLDLKLKSIRASKALREIINPFVLRRTKNILKATGRLKANKFEVTVWLQISPLQMKLYEALTQHKLLRLRGRAFAGSQVAQDICMHPALVVIDDACNEGMATVKLKKSLMGLLAHNLPAQSKEQEGQQIILQGQLYEDYTSSRLEFVLYLLPKLIQDSHKILVFSQSPRMLEILQGKLATIIDKEMVIRMDGTTSRKERMRLINEFQSNVTAPLVFLMTTKVGGLGITLTKASRVLILDPSENPSDDNQAVDRAYRIGQEKDVVVYRLIMCGTIEEHIYREQILKVETAYAVLEESQVKRGITKQEGFVLSMPREGFSVSRTHRQLTETHGYTFDRSISTEVQLVKSHESVVDVFNHSVIFSLKEDLVVADVAHNANYKDALDDFLPLEEEGHKGSKVKETLAKKQFIQATTQIPRHLIPFFKSKGKTTEVKRASGCTMVQIMRTDRPDLEEVVLMGYIDETMKARHLIQDIVNKTKTEEIFVRRDKAGLIIGKGGVTIRHIEDVTGAHVQVIDRKDNIAEKTVIITGTSQQRNEAKQMILNAVKGWKP